jgi:hypothetical protein
MSIAVQRVTPKAPTAAKSRPPKTTEEREGDEPVNEAHAAPPPGSGQLVDKSI